jgi:hypothetical protein
MSISKFNHEGIIDITAFEAFTGYLKSKLRIKV